MEASGIRWKIVQVGPELAIEVVEIKGQFDIALY